MNEDDRVELVARALCRAHDARLGNAPDTGALVAFQAGSCAVAYWDDLARAAITALQGVNTTVTEAMIWHVARAISIPEHHTTWGTLTDRQKDLYFMQAEYALSAMRTTAPTAQDDNGVRIEAELDRIADYLTDQQDEPWPNGSESDRLHYWRDKAIKGANMLRAARGDQSPDVSGGGR